MKESMIPIAGGICLALAAAGTMLPFRHREAAEQRNEYGFREPWGEGYYCHIAGNATVYLCRRFFRYRVYPVSGEPPYRTVLHQDLRHRRYFSIRAGRDSEAENQVRRIYQEG